MGFFSGPITFECFRISGEQPRAVRPGARRSPWSASPSARPRRPRRSRPTSGSWPAGTCSTWTSAWRRTSSATRCTARVRIDTNQIPAAVRKAWLQMELAAYRGRTTPAAGPPRPSVRRPRRPSRPAAKKRPRAADFRRMQQFPVLWDARNGLLYFGGSSRHGQRTVLRPVRPGVRPGAGAAHGGPARPGVGGGGQAAEGAGGGVALRRSTRNDAAAEIAWWNHEAGNFDFLGNEFLLWLWWRWETQSDTIDAAGRLRSDRHARPDAQLAVPAGRVGQGDDHRRVARASAGSGAGHPLGQAAPQSRPDAGPPRRAVRAGAPGRDLLGQRGEDPDAERERRKAAASWRTGSRASAACTRRSICSSGRSASGGSARAGPANWSRSAAG